ncbi:MAG: hypothetical protein G01um1014106_287, partial [Parcubacteria group bacterium Gr01-1014_106]
MKFHGISPKWTRAGKKLTAGWLIMYILISAIAPISFTLFPQEVFAQTCPGGNCPLQRGGGISIPPSNIGGGGINFGRGEFDQGGGLFGGGFFRGGGGGEGLRGLLGGAIRGLLKNPAMLLLLVTLLQQLFSGFGRGGATPQTGAVEEQPIFGSGSIGPTRTGSRDGSGTTPSFSLTEPAVVYRLDESGISPSFFTIQRGQFIRIVNTANGNRTLYSDPHDPARATPGAVTDACGTLSPNQTCRVYFTEPGAFGFHVHEVPTQRAT